MVPRPQRPAHREWADHSINTKSVPLGKRAADIGLILLLSPLLLLLAALIALWILWVSPGPVLFRQTRVGRGGRAFTICKFRTMRQRAETAIHEYHVEQLIQSNQPMMKLDLCGDPRLITGGGMIRMSGLDELPQVLNILRGEMSLVGPRPCTPCEFPHYDPSQYARFAVMPGLTGLWQVLRDGTTTFQEMVRMDIEYAERLSPANDLIILLKTPGAVIGQLAGYTRSRTGRVAGSRKKAAPIRRAIEEALRAHGL